MGTWSCGVRAAQLTPGEQGERFGRHNLEVPAST